jgi:hypothetical protein
VFHVELRQFPHVGRAFNLSAEELGERITGPWVRDQMVQLNERRWAPERARLTIYEGPALRPDEIGLGRGWANVTRAGVEVTERVLAEVRRTAPVAPAPPSEEAVAELRELILARCASGPLGLDEVVAIVSDRHALQRVSERVALAEQSVWGLLGEGRVRIARAGTEIPRDEWAATLLAWGAWSDPGEARVVLESGN